MMRFVVAANGFTRHPDTAHALIEALCVGNHHAVLVLDTATIEQRVGTLEPALSASPFVKIALADWLQGGSPDVRAICATSKNIPANSIIVLDSTDHDCDQTSAVLLQCQQAWFHLDDWHRAFVLLCDELALYHWATEMQGRFYISSESLLDSALARKVRHIQRKAWLLRWFGHGRILRLAQLLFRLKGWLLRRVFA